jgi:alanine-synthesizing transaminase
MIEAVHQAMRDGKNGYSPSSGIPQALEAIRGEATSKGITNIQDVFVTSGVSETVDICLSALLDAGDDLLTPCPDYPLYSAVLAKLEIGLNAYYLSEEDGWQPDLADVEKKITPRTRGIILINPNNPTGSVCTRTTLEKIAELARRHNLIIFADEIYDKLIIDDDPHVAMAGVAPDVPVITFGGLSKNYLAPGWRIGWGIASGERSVIKPYLEGVNKLLRARLCANHPEQYAIKAALDGPQDHLLEVRQKLRNRRDLTMKWCAETSRVSCVARCFLRLPQHQYPRRRRRLRHRAHSPQACDSSAWLRLRPAPRHQTFPHRFSPRRKDAGCCLHGDWRIHARALRIDNQRSGGWTRLHGKRTAALCAAVICYLRPPHCLRYANDVEN